MRVSGEDASGLRRPAAKPSRAAGRPKVQDGPADEMARMDDATNGKEPIRQLSKQDGVHDSSNTLTHDELVVARKEMDEGVRWAVREKVGTPCGLAQRRPVPLAACPSLDSFFLFSFSVTRPFRWRDLRRCCI